MIPALNCPLCRSQDTPEYFRDSFRTYRHCRNCGLIFVPFWQFVSKEEEKKRYDQHQNSVDSPGYRRFLSRLFVPLEQGLARGSKGLDFGSGPAPVLSQLFKEAGYAMTCFDIFYAPDPGAFDKRYDFICASEVVEHLHDPKRELDRLWSCLKPGGKLGIMTHFFQEQAPFPEWYYKNDRTHVCFFSRAVFLWLGEQWQTRPEFPEDDVIILRKDI